MCHWPSNRFLWCSARAYIPEFYAPPTREVKTINLPHLHGLVFVDHKTLAAVLFGIIVIADWRITAAVE